MLLNIERINRINERVVVLPNEANGVEYPPSNNNTYLFLDSKVMAAL